MKPSAISSDKLLRLVFGPKSVIPGELWVESGADAGIQVERGPDEVTQRICGFITQKANDLPELEAAISKAGKRKGQLSQDQWKLVTSTIRSKLALLLATTENPRRFLELADRQRGVLGEEVYAGIIEFIDTASATQI